MRFVSLIVCMMLAGTSYAEDRFYGLLTTDSFPLKNCIITDISPLSMRQWEGGDTSDGMIKMQDELDESFAKAAISKGFNVVLGYTTSFSSSGNQAIDGNTYLSGVVEARGVMAKVKCK